MILVLTKHQLYRLCIESLKEKKKGVITGTLAINFCIRIEFVAEAVILEGQKKTCTFWPSTIHCVYFFSCKKCKSALCCLNCEQHNVTISHNWFHKLQFIKAVLGRPHPAPVEPLLINFHKSRRNRFTLNTHGPAN